MTTLRELRIANNLTQTDVAKMIGENAPNISNYENGVALPSLENMIILERRFGQRITWADAQTARAKHDTIQSLIELCERYPVPAVMEFAARVYRRESAADRIIAHFANTASGGDVNPLMPTDFTNK